MIKIRRAVIVLLTLLPVLALTTAASASSPPGTEYSTGRYSTYSVDCHVPQQVVPPGDADVTHSQYAITVSWTRRVRTMLTQPVGHRTVGMINLEASDPGTGYHNVAMIYRLNTPASVPDNTPCARSSVIPGGNLDPEYQWNPSNPAYDYHTAHVVCSTGRTARSTFHNLSDVETSAAKIIRHQEETHDFGYGAVSLGRPGHLAWHLAMPHTCPQRRAG